MSATLQVPPLVAGEAVLPVLKPQRVFGFVEIPDTKEVVGTGWLPDIPDLLGHTEEHPEVAKIVDNLGIPRAKKMKAALPATMDLRQWCSPIENQGILGSCTANAAVGIVEYFERRAFNTYMDGSRLFVYKATRDMLNWTGDTGAFLRTTMGALALFGMPPEKHWPYIPFNFDTDPPAFVWQYAEHFEALVYYRLDPPGSPLPDVLGRIKANVAAGLPSMFGFTVYSSIAQAAHSGLIPFPSGGEPVVGGHAVDVVGYDDALKIRNTNPGGPETVGAFLIRNSWGTGWGQAGYGYLPYDYVLKGLAADWWSLVKASFVNTQAFGV